MASELSDAQIVIPTSVVEIPKPLQMNKVYSESISNSPFASYYGNQQQQQQPRESSIADELGGEPDEDANLNILLRKVTEYEQKQLAIVEQQQQTEPLPSDEKAVASSPSDENVKVLNRSVSMTQSIGSVKSSTEVSYTTFLERMDAGGGGTALHLLWERFEASLGIADETGIIGADDGGQVNLQQ